MSSWNQFRSKMKGQGYTVEQLSIMYKKSAQASPKKSHSAGIEDLSCGEILQMIKDKNCNGGEGKNTTPLPKKRIAKRTVKKKTPSPLSPPAPKRIAKRTIKKKTPPAVVPKRIAKRVVKKKIPPPVPPKKRTTLSKLNIGNLPPEIRSSQTAGSPKSHYSPPQQSYLEQLPNEVAFEIIKQLSIGEVLSLCATSKKLAGLCQDDHFWKQKTLQLTGRKLTKEEYKQENSGKEIIKEYRKKKQHNDKERKAVYQQLITLHAWKNAAEFWLLSYLERREGRGSAKQPLRTQQNVLLNNLIMQRNWNAIVIYLGILWKDELKNNGKYGITEYYFVQDLGELKHYYKSHKFHGSLRIIKEFEKYANEILLDVFIKLVGKYLPQNVDELRKNFLKKVKTLVEMMERTQPRKKS